MGASSRCAEAEWSLLDQRLSGTNRGISTEGVIHRGWTITIACATIVAMTSAEPLRSVRDHLSEVVDRVQRHHERVIITRNGHDAAVVISPEDLAQLEETIAVLGDPEALADIREADAAYERGDVIRGVEAVRQLHGD
jgi:prevent-host-death family protein